MKKLLFGISALFTVLLFSPKPANAAVVIVTTGPGYYAPGWYWGPYGYRYYHRPYWHRRYWHHGRWYYR
ncbi:MAG: hypothetical protein JO271_01430 [Verrucomicrobia bacterium]|nr:hypothetical protein [Verrucomicrobiota bacterium]MBV9275273.1 hypothetical protein [Verrucomicrobiota bacterium]